jgi:Uma2 family endonuclease
MATASLIPVSEYLRTTYRPDCDYIDGELKERTMGERPHSLLQLIVGTIFMNNFDSWKLTAMTEQRVQINPSRFRIPDICVVRASDPADNIVVVPPLLCIEILSSDDRFSRLQERVNDFAGMGVQNIWVLDPWDRTAYYASRRGFTQPEDGTLRIEGTSIAITLADVFAQLDRLSNPSAL